MIVTDSKPFLNHQNFLIPCWCLIPNFLRLCKAGLFGTNSSSFNCIWLNKVLGTRAVQSDEYTVGRNILLVDVQYIPAVIKYAEPSALGDDIVLCTNPCCAGLRLQSQLTCASMVHLRWVDRLKLKVAFIITGDINGCIASASPRRRDMNVCTSTCIMTATVKKWIIHIGGEGDQIWVHRSKGN